MLGWIYRLIVGRFTGCNHHWEVIDSRKFTYSEGYFHRMTYTLKCKHCGNIKQKDIT